MSSRSSPHDTCLFYQTPNVNKLDHTSPNNTTRNRDASLPQRGRQKMAVFASRSPDASIIFRFKYTSIMSVNFTLSIWRAVDERNYRWRKKMMRSSPHATRELPAHRGATWIVARLDACQKQCAHRKACPSTIDKHSRLYLIDIPSMVFWCLDIHCHRYNGLNQAIGSHSEIVRGGTRK